MNSDHDHTAACDGICHLNTTAQALYWDLRYADRHDEAEALRTTGAGFPA